ncbi:MAG: NAD-dependent epimerase/dehydratase family protein [Rhodospirillales bacterium]
MTPASCLIVGGAGFIGSHLTGRLLAIPETSKVTLYDNFSSGREWHFHEHVNDPRLEVVRGDVKDLERLMEAMRGHDAVVHLASNPDIARAASEPEIDFHQGTLLTHNVVEAMRRTGCANIIYASGSGIYGDLGEMEVPEDYGPLAPISTYGASKLAGEAMISAYCHMFAMRGLVFRFANVVGPRQTHGVGLDFIRHILAANKTLPIMGDGNQSKSYIHVDDVISAIFTAYDNWEGYFRAFNVATGDYITVKEIAAMAVECAGLGAADVGYEFAGGKRGWKGDIPVVRLDTRRIRELGWRCSHSSAQAIRRSLEALAGEVRAGKH